jgi:hypothetical protein
MISEMVESFTSGINLEGESQWKGFQHWWY